MEEKVLTCEQLLKVDDFTYEIPKTFRSDMRVPARVFANQAMLEAILQDRSLEQLVNVATLPGIQRYAFAMPDIHQGYGFPIGGVAAMAIDEGGVISPGGIGYDINCGVRLLVANVTNLTFIEMSYLSTEFIRPKVPHETRSSNSIWSARPIFIRPATYLT